MNFYLGQKDNEHKVNVEVAPKITETLDETLDGAEVVLEANTIQNPIAPMTAFYIEFSNSEYITMYVMSDSVEIFSTSPLKYKHTLSLIQNIQKLSKYIVRNSVFTQPSQKVKKSYFGITQFLSEINDPAPGHETEKILTHHIAYMCSEQNKCEIKFNLSSKEKIKDVYIMITYFAAINDLSINKNINNFSNNETLEDLGSKIDASRPIRFCEDGSGNSLLRVYTDDSAITISPEDIEGGKILFNTPLRVPKLKSLLQGKQGIYASTVKQTQQSISSQPVDWQSYAIPFENVTYGYNHKNIAFACTQISVCVETYYYDCYDILKLLQERQQQKMYLNGYKSKPELFKVPISTPTGQLLKNTIAPNFTFTQCTMYECVAEVFRLFDAIFTLDENNYLVIDYLNNVQEDTPSVSETDFSGETRSITNEKYNDGLISYYQDARIKELFPSENYVRPTSQELGVPSADDHVVLTPHKIDNVTRMLTAVWGLTFAGVGSMGNQEYFTGKLSYHVNFDITPYVLEEQIWSITDGTAFNIQNIDYRTLYQGNTIYYSKGSNIINLGYSYKAGLFQTTRYGFWNLIDCSIALATGLLHLESQPKWFSYDNPAEQDWKEVWIKVAYETSVDGRVKNESITNKYDGDMLIDQYNGSVDLNKMGLNMLGLSLKLGEPTLTATHKITSWNDRLRKGSVYIDSDGKKWVANICSYTILDSEKIQGQISFTCNYNALAMRTKLIRERRMTNIAPELTQKSEDNLVEYIYFANNSIDEVHENTCFTYHFKKIISNSFPWFGEDKPFYKEAIPDMAVINRSSYIPSIHNFGTADYIPLIRYAAGNSFCFEMSYNDPISIINSTSYETGQWYGDKYFTHANRYTETDGFMKWTSVGIFNSKDTRTINFPRIRFYTTQEVIKIHEYYCEKQPNEIFALNYQICFLPWEREKDEIFLGRAFYENNPLIVGDYGAKKMYIHFGYGKYNILDTEPIDGGEQNDVQEVTDIYVTEVSGETTVMISHDDLSKNYTCWALTDSDNNIYVMSNVVRKDLRFQQIHFITRHTRIK